MSNGIAPAKQLVVADTDAIRLVQVTDPHLYQDADGKLLGLTTAESFTAVIDSVSLLNPTPDFMLVTGDISQDGSAASYQRLCRGIARLPYPSFWIPGNHDELPVMAQALTGSNVYADKRMVAGRWQIVLLNSAVPHRVYGKLQQDQLDFLRAAIAEYPQHHLLVVLHHHPVNVDCFWLDTIGLNNADALFAVMQQHQGVKAVLWGHIHQAFDHTQNDIRMMATPSTCVQFKPHSVEFQADSESPGFRTLTLRADGHIDTDVHRIRHMEFTVDYSVKGY